MKSTTSIVVAFVAFMALFMAIPTLSAQVYQQPASVGVRSITAASNVASPFFISAKNIQWNTANYSAYVGVNINLLRRISDSPVQYQLVRQIASNTPNDGIHLWIPQVSDLYGNLFIEVTCSTTTTHPQGCFVTTMPLKAN